MNVLIVDPECLGLDFAIRCAASGHSVKWFRYHKTPSREGEGFKGFKIVDDWRPHMAWARDGLILNTGNFRYVYELDQYRAHGFKIFSPTVASAKLEIDRSAGMKAMEAAGIELPPYHVFDSLQDAEKFARKSDRCWVFKPMGDEEDKSLTRIGRDPADLCGWIRRKIEAGGKLKGQCMLQEKVDVLCELGVSGWFGPDGFLPGKFQRCVEHKRLCDGEIGPNTGEMGTLTNYAETDKLADELLLPLTAAFQATGHRGDTAVGACIDTKGKPLFLEFTMRLGWPCFMIQVASHKGDPAQWARDLLDGKDTLKVSSDVAIGVVMAQPRWPYNCSPPGSTDGNPISGLEEVFDDIHLAGAMVGKGPVLKGGKVVDGPQYQTAGDYVLVATGLGKTITKARKAAYDVVDRVNFSDAIYRTDIGQKVIDVLPKVQKFGYLDGVEA